MSYQPQFKHWGKQTPLSQIAIPDLWEIAHLPELKGYSLGGKSARDLIIECWHLAHDMKKTLEAIAKEEEVSL